jgi:ABC-type oligopeptide transport system ATPase subunit
MTEQACEAVLQLQDVSVAFTSGAGKKKRTVRAMESVSLSVAAGETFGLVGESGSGKTTTASVALGLKQPDLGQVLLFGAPIARSRRENVGKIQAVLQHPHWSLNPRRKVGESVREPLAVVRKDLSRKAQRTHVLEAIEQVGLDAALANRYPHELSGGQRQRVSIARALVTKPRFIVFDEAVSALDVAVQLQILTLIRQLQAEHAFGALFISHDLGAVERVSDRVGVLLRGELVETATTAELFAHPKHSYSQQLLESL